MFIPIIAFLLILSQISLYFQAESVFYNVGPLCTYKIDQAFEKSKQLLLEIMHGRLPFTAESLPEITYDIDFIERINYNIPCPYTLKSLELEDKMNGIFIGAGINLINFNESQMEEILDNVFMPQKEKNLIKSFCGKSGVEANKIINSGYNMNINIRQFNKEVINYAIKNKLEKDFEPIINKLKVPFINGFLSAYVSLPNIEPELYQYLVSNFTSSSYIIKHLFEGAPFARFIQSKLIALMDGTIKYNNVHVFFVIPMIFTTEEIKNIKNLINNFLTTSYNNYIFNRNRISILLFNDEDKKYIINLTPRKRSAFDQIFNMAPKNISISINLTEIYEYVSNLYKKNDNKELYENKIVALFLDIKSNYSDSIKPNLIVEKYQKEGIQTIPFINKPDDMKTPYLDIIKYNLYFEFRKQINVRQLIIAVSHMHIFIDFTKHQQYLNSEGNIERKIDLIGSNDIDAPIYFEVNINQGKNESEYYEISFDIIKTEGYNIFLSDNNPYPNIKDYTHKLINYDNNFNPKMRIKTHLKNQFYLGVEGIVYFNITITRKYNNDNREILFSEGEFNEQSYNVSISFKDDLIKNLETFSSDYKPKLNLLNNNIYNSLDNILKYFTRGIDLYNTEDGLFFNYNLFLYLFSNSYLINKVYRNSENYNYYIGRYIELTQTTPFRLKEDGLNQLIINKIYPFLNGNNKTIIGKDPPAVSFNDNELKLIYNITNKKYVNNLITLLNRTTDALDFKEHTAEMKFILLCLYFINPKDTSLVKKLGLEDPKYSEVLSALINRNKNPDTLTKFLISFISNMDQEKKFEKIIISVIMGQSLILSDSGIKFVEDFYNGLSKAKAKISLSVYDTLATKNEIKTVIPFYSNKKNTKLDLINEYKNEYSNIRDKYNGQEKQNMDFDKIINYGLSQLSIYDKGIKKEIFIICDENIKTEKDFYINNKLINLNYNKHTELRKYQIKLILISTKNYEKGEIPELFNFELESNENLPYTIFENYFHVNDLANTNLYMNDLARMAKDSIIKLNLGERYINDFYHAKINYYEINIKNFVKDVIVIKANLSNFNFYYSFDNPFPNSYIDIKAEKTADDDKIVIEDIKNDKIYLGIESKNEMKKQIIEIFSCESYYSKKQYFKCKFVDDQRLLWYLLILFIAAFIIGSIVYYSKPTRSINKSQLNIFD